MVNLTSRDILDLLMKEKIGPNYNILLLILERMMQIEDMIAEKADIRDNDGREIVRYYSHD